MSTNATIALWGAIINSTIWVSTSFNLAGVSAIMGGIWLLMAGVILFKEQP